jgi:hypothetical protein
MKKHLFLLSLFFATSVFAQQPPKWQALKECNQAQELAKQIAVIKNSGATRSDISQIRSMASDGMGIMGDLALVFFDMHKKDSNADKFSIRMYERCMRSNGY